MKNRNIKALTVYWYDGSRSKFDDLIGGSLSYLIEQDKWLILQRQNEEEVIKVNVGQVKYYEITKMRA